ncbi:MAG: zinc ribbon domain-containing protein [Chloroflexia bacterium]|nr:zinc ribbon domain-containing protein [Chloroflexia bacterium]
MWILFGFSTRQKELGQQTRYCTRCEKETAHTAIQQQQWFTLFFIPVIPLSGKKVVDRCNLCGQTGSHVEGAAALELKQQAQFGKVKTCPSCAEQIQFEAARCRYCGHEFDPAEVEAAKQSLQEHQLALAAAQVAQTRQAEHESRVRRFRVWGIILALLGGAILALLICALATGSWQQTEDTGTAWAAHGCFLVPALVLLASGGFLIWKSTQLGQQEPGQ